MEINLPFDSSEQTMELIKLAALFFTRVNLLCPESNSEDYQLHREKMLEGFHALKENEIICIKETNDDVWLLARVAERLFKTKLPRANERIDNLLPVYELYAQKLLGDYFWLPEDRRNIIRELFTTFENAKYGAQLHYGYQIAASYDSICSNQHCISSNEFLQKDVERFLKIEGKLGRFRSMSHSHIPMSSLSLAPILLSNFSSLSYEDILEMRLKASDELKELRYYLSELSSKYDAEDKHLINAKEYIERDIQQKVKEFESKVCGLQVGTIQRALKGALAVSPVPMLTTFCTNIPAWISIGASAGIITADAALEYIKQKKELATDPLYFTVKLRKYGKGKGKNA